jgi:hypothetical protein
VSQVTTDIFEGFSVSHAAILDGHTPAEVAAAELESVYGVREASMAADQGNFDNTGDDVVLSTWFWFNYVTVTVKSGYIPFDTIALLTGSEITYTASNSVGASTYSIPIWEVQSMNQPQRPMLVRVPSKDSNGNIAYLDYVLYKVQFQPISFDGPTYKSGLTIDYSGRALVSTLDETGTALANRGIGRLIATYGNPPDFVA